MIDYGVYIVGEGERFRPTTRRRYCIVLNVCRKGGVLMIDLWVLVQARFGFFCLLLDLGFEFFELSDGIAITPSSPNYSAAPKFLPFR